MIRIVWGFSHRVPFLPKHALVFVSKIRASDVGTARALDAGVRFLADHLERSLPFGLAWVYEER